MELEDMAKKAPASAGCQSNGKAEKEVSGTLNLSSSNNDYDLEANNWRVW
jgi:hypothetical protein